MPFALLLSMQAAGMIVDWFGTKNQSEMAKMGAKLQQAGLEANLQQTRLEAEDASLEAMRTLRKNIGSQIAVFAARGTSTGSGSALAIRQESVNNFNSDERMRRLNLLGREASIKAGASIAQLNQSAENAKLWSGFASRSLQRFPTSSAGWGQFTSDIKEGFGLTKIGG